MTALKIALGVLIALACLIPYLALTDAYERSLEAEPRQARVIDVRDGVVRYEVHSPQSPWDDDHDGWVGPYSDEEVPANAAARLSSGDPLVVRDGQLALSRRPPTKLLWLGVVGGVLFALWSLVGPILERRAVAKARANPIELFERMARKTRNGALIRAVAIAAMSAPMVALPFVLEAATWERAFIGGLGAIGILFAAFVAYGAWELRDPSRAPIVVALRETPQRIVWVYEHCVEVNGVDSHNLLLFGDDGTRYAFHLGQLDPEPVLAALEARLPHAIFGFSPERRAAYDRSPATFASGLARSA